jgi:REP element-mobilizing transposase RayT
MEQIGLRFPPKAKRGGKREGAGRKRISRRENVPHRVRARHNHAHPVHVTLRVRGGLPALRHRGLFAQLRTAIHGASRSPAVGAAFRVVEFSIQDDHAHFIVEAHDTKALSSGVRGLAIRLARAFNRAVGIRGQVWGDRYDARPLKTPWHVRNAIVYVLMNAKKHGVASGNIDAFSSAPWFRGFTVAIEPPLEESVVVVARTWLANVGWKRRGLVSPDERPHAPD